MILVRIYGRSSDLFVDRNRERKIFKVSFFRLSSQDLEEYTINLFSLHQLLHYRGYAPKLYLTFENGMAFEYLPGATLNIELSQDPRVYPLVAQMVAKIHKLDFEDETNRTPRIWSMIDQFVDLIPEVFTSAEKDSK